MIEDEQAIINDEMRMSKILTDDFGVGKTVHHSFSRGEGERKGLTCRTTHAQCARMIKEESQAGQNAKERDFQQRCEEIKV